MYRFLVLILAIWSGLAMATEQPKYEVLYQQDEFELREYSQMIVAETLVNGAMDDASGDGFRAIADFIFGNNRSASGSSEKISMTAPVTMASASSKVSMTSSAEMEDKHGKWRVHFVMPSEYTMETLPKPNSEAVTLREVPVTRFAVISFSGLTGEKKVSAKTTELLTWLQEKGITPRGEPELARYDPPWTLPFLRRNEVMVEY
ncbi:SOUL family heme-binding protein [Corallincola platygyrae]|uniref:SOUL family heme-binding protein n=1 Tax=Corallincola platygyrae TaxID=1193278 RepID=A0ABW4XNT7_9GAMM